MVPVIAVPEAVQKQGDWRTVCPYCDEEITGDTKEEVLEKEGRHRAQHFDGNNDTDSSFEAETVSGKNLLDEFAAPDPEQSLDLDPNRTYYVYSRTGMVHRPAQGRSSRTSCGHDVENMERVEDPGRLNADSVRRCRRCFDGGENQG